MYIKTVWYPKQTIVSADNLNKMENGIESAHNALDTKANRSEVYSKSEVDNLIQNSSGNAQVDLTNYATHDDVRNAVAQIPKGDKGEKGERGEKGEKGDTGTVDTTDFYTKSQTDNKILEEIAKAQLNGSGSTSVDLTPYATKDYVADEIAKIQPIKGDKGDKGDKGEQGEKGERGEDGLTTSVNNIPHINGNITLTANDVDTYAKSEIDSRLGGLTFWSGTQEQYNAIVSKSNSTIYFITQ